MAEKLLDQVDLAADLKLVRGGEVAPIMVGHALGVAGLRDGEVNAFMENGLK
jgi:hypothetical protein